MIRLSAFADEASSNFREQIAALKRNGIGYIELRGLDGKNVSVLTEEEADDYAQMLRKAGIGVSAMGSPLGKVSINEDFDEYKKLVRHVCRLARIFGTERIRMFSFYDAYESEEKVYAQLREMVAIAAEEGVKLYHENEKEIFGDTAERNLRILENVPGLQFVYDPANFVEVGEPAEKTLELLHSRAGYFHIKDVIAATGELVPAGYGDGKIPELVARIGDEDKILTIEPHLKIFAGFSEIDHTQMKNKFEFESNDQAFDAAVTAIKNILKQAGYTETEGGFIK